MDSDVLVTTKLGLVRGKVATHRKDRKYYSFQSIPYAKPPVGCLRFEAPQPPDMWENILDATKDPPQCFQPPHPSWTIPGGQEDCLYLNVYTPQLPTPNNALLAVLVWFHGGLFIVGSSSKSVFGPKFLMHENFLLVTVNFRLGFLGFLSQKNQSLGVPGNAGLKDQVMALRWVQDNIKNFGGDPTKVTIAGHSTGGSSVHFHMLSPMSVGLFNGAIMQSGCALNFWSEGITGSAEMLAKELNITESDPKGLIDALKQVPVEKILAAQVKLFPFVSITKPWGFGIVVENQTNEPAFLSNTPLNIIQSNQYNKVPLLLGYTSSEGMLLYLYSWKDYSTDLTLRIPYGFNKTLNSTITNKMKEFYFQNDDSLLQNKHINFKLDTDLWFSHAIIKTALKTAETSKFPVYLYRFSAETRLNFLKNRFPASTNFEGVSHYDDLPYIFDTSITPDIEEDSREYLSVERMVRLWANFVKYGNPTPRLDSVVGVIWKPVKKNEMNFLDIGNQLTCGLDLDIHRFQFWEAIYNLNISTEKSAV